MHEGISRMIDAPQFTYALRPKIPALTGLRFAAAASVLISHSVALLIPNAWQFSGWALYVMKLGGIGMPLFFVLSGFVIHYNYARLIASGGKVELANFFASRFARLYPLFFICLVGDLGFAAIYFGSYSPAIFDPLPFYLTMTQSWFFPRYNAGMTSGVTWSISTEWFFYLVYPLICFFLLRLASARHFYVTLSIFLALSVLTITCAALIKPQIDSFAIARWGAITGNQNDSLFTWLLYFAPYLRLFDFTLGVFCAAAYRRLENTPVRIGGQRFGLIVLSAAFVGIGCLHWLLLVSEGSFADISNLTTKAALIYSFAMGFGYAPLVALVIFCCARYRNPIVTLFSSKPFELCGEASYSIYMLHMFVIFLLRPYTDREAAWSTFNVCMVLLAIFSTIAISLVSWRFLETPARKRVYRLLSIRRTATAASPQLAS